MPLIVFEGIDGCGKTTQHQRSMAWARERGLDPLGLREPGGTPLGERLRDLLLDPETKACPVAELFLYQAARAQLCQTVIAPALAQGRLVLMDRFWYSTVAYQGFGHGLDLDAVWTAARMAMDDVRVDLALWYDVDPATASRRRAAARGQEDRIEARGLEYLERVRGGYAEMSEEAWDDRPIRVDATPSADEVWEVVRWYLEGMLS